jgi:hypothetical protein
MLDEDNLEDETDDRGGRFKDAVGLDDDAVGVVGILLWATRPEGEEALLCRPGSLIGFFSWWEDVDRLEADRGLLVDGKDVLEDDDLVSLNDDGFRDALPLLGVPAAPGSEDGFLGVEEWKDRSKVAWSCSG